MVIKKRITNTISRTQLLLLLAIWESILILLFLKAAGGGLGVLFVIIPHQLLLPFAAAAGLKATETITLTREGISFHPFLHKRMYSWAQIQQVGIFLCKGRNHKYWAIAIVPIDGVRHTQQDVWDGHVSYRFTGTKGNILFPASEDAREIIEQNYGPLDFDLSDG